MNSNVIISSKCMKFCCCVLKVSYILVCDFLFKTIHFQHVRYVCTNLFSFFFIFKICKHVLNMCRYTYIKVRNIFYMVMYIRFWRKILCVCMMRDGEFKHLSLMVISRNIHFGTGLFLRSDYNVNSVWMCT